MYYEIITITLWYCIWNIYNYLELKFKLFSIANLVVITILCILILKYKDRLSKKNLQLIKNT